MVRDADHRLDLLIDSIRDYAVFMLDAHGRVQTWNTGAQLIKGYSASEIVGKTLHQFYLPEDRASCRPERLLETAAREGRVEDEGWRVRKDGTKFWADVIISAVRENGKLIGYVKVTRDLTDKRRVEEERLHQEQRFRLLVQSARDYSIFMLDTRGNVATWNDGAQRIKGYTAEEIIGKHFSIFVPPDEVAAGKCETELTAALAEGRFEDEGWRLRKGGQQFWANVVITPLFDSSGNHIGFSKITRDLTERRASELDRIELARSHEALRLRDEFLSIASHELRTPLMALQLQLDSLAVHPDKLDPRQASKLDRASRNVQRLVDLISALLDVSRIARGKLVIAPVRADLAAIVGDAVDRLQDSAHEARCTIHTQLEPGVTGSWDPLRLGQVVSNLLANAFRYAAGTEIAVTVERRGTNAVLRVEDGGPGIPEHQLARVFERFERAAPANNYGGMGLGLYVAREIIAAHGGTIVATNRDGGGARLEVTLPAEVN